MREYRILNINDFKPEEYAAFGIALLIMRNHNWECRSIINGKLHLTRFVKQSDDYYDFGEKDDYFPIDYKMSFEEDFGLETIGAIKPFKKKN